MTTVSPSIVAVASTTRQDKLASYSTYGSGLVDLAAPGSSILSLGITGTTACDAYSMPRRLTSSAGSSLLANSLAE